MKRAIVIVSMLVVSFAIFFVFNPDVWMELTTDLSSLDFSGLLEALGIH